MLRIAASLLLAACPILAQVDWRFAHPGADMLMGFNLKSLITSPAGAPIREALGGLGGMNRDRLRMLEDVDEVYVSVRTKYVKSRPAGEPLGVILLRGNFDSGSMMKLFEKQPKVAARFIDRHTILLGDEESMAGAAERLKADDGLESPVLARAKELAAANDFWLVGSPAPVAGLKPRGSFKKEGGMLGEIESIFDNLRSFSIGIALRNDLALDLGLNLRSKAAALQLMSLYQRFEADMKKTPEGAKRWADFSQALEVHPNGSSVRLQMRGTAENFQAAMTQATQGLFPVPVQVPVAAPAPVVAKAAPAPVAVPAPAPAPVRQTVRIYGMESGYREIPTSPR
ncbi:MAG: hypothetical protein K2X03_06460 [Bryobacteraceae bacterium]|nr:hypothetical protein [Bryobacteraceae bacterium]